MLTKDCDPTSSAFPDNDNTSSRGLNSMYKKEDQDHYPLNAMPNERAHGDQLIAPSAQLRLSASSSSMQQQQPARYSDTCDKSDESVLRQRLTPSRTATGDEGRTTGNGLVLAAVLHSHYPSGNSEPFSRVGQYRHGRTQLYQLQRTSHLLAQDTAPDHGCDRAQHPRGYAGRIVGVCAVSKICVFRNGCGYRLRVHWQNAGCHL